MIKEYILNIFKRLNIEIETEKQDKEIGGRDTRVAGNEEKKDVRLAALKLHNYLRLARSAYNLETCY